MKYDVYRWKPRYGFRLLHVQQLVPNEKFFTAMQFLFVMVIGVEGLSSLEDCVVYL